MTKPFYLLYDSCRVGTGPGSDTNPLLCCWNKLHMVKNAKTTVSELWNGGVPDSLYKPTL